MSSQMTLWATANVTSSPESAAGRSPCASPESPTTSRSGQARARASRSASPERAEEPTTSGTSGPSCGASSLTERLQSSLASRLRQTLDGRGSPLCALTWKTWPMESGPPICALRASALRTGDSGSGGALSGWMTPLVQDARHSGLASTGGYALKLVYEAQLAGWPTPTTRDHKDGTADGTAPPNALLGRVCWEAKGAARLTADGVLLTGSTAGMESGGRLDPALARWLMGYPPAWDDCAATATPSCRRSRRRS